MIEQDEGGPIVLEEEPEAGRPDQRRVPAIPSALPILPLKGTVVFPHLPMPLAIGRASSRRVIDEAMLGSKIIGIFAQKDPSIEEPRAGDLYDVGTAALIQRLLKFPDGTLRVLVDGLERVRLTRMVQSEPYTAAEVEVLKEETETSVEMEALAKNLLTQVQKILALMPIPSEDLGVALLNVEDSGRLADMAAALLVRDAARKQEYLETLSVKERLRKLTRHVNRELEVLEVGSKIQQEVQDEMEKGQREFVLRQQLKAIQKELGVGDETEAEILRLQEEIEKAGMPQAVREVAERELGRLRTMPPAAAEQVVVRTYLDWLTHLPWSRRTEDKIDLAAARRILDEDHHDLEKVKERILEFLAVRKLKADSRGTILCFVGPPGTGKTSLGRSLARAMGRSFHRLSLGGVRDEAEIRGHRRTYVGALPGQIVQGMRRCGTRNPVFMLDEVDKLGADFRGDPASALLEVLDPEQNHAFVDHYIDLPFDLSGVMFITTANVLDTVPRPLLDRMEVLDLPGYIEEEKVAIARRYLLPRQSAENGLEPDDLDLGDEALALIISRYTQEAGVRNLEREIARICRKIARRRAEGATGRVTVGAADLDGFLGPERYASEVTERMETPGVSVGLAWTPNGGHILFVEATRMPGGKSLTLTGQLGDVMRESALAALSYLRSRAAALGIEGDFYRGSDLHVHVPAGAIPKDGPSAGVTMATALASLLTGRPCRPDTAMTGEITLRGKVLPVGGIKEKVLGAHRAGIKTVILPAENLKDLRDVPKPVLDSLQFRFARTVDEVLEAALQPARLSGAKRHAGRRARAERLSP
ncbi:MAG: endopeptidase La [Acidobacteria bacterium]|nr:endopeptidase La [Acidobacteriota bacterium]